MHQFLKVADLVLHEEAEVLVFREELGNDCGGAVLAVGSTESVVDIAVAERGKLTGEFFTALGLLGIETDVFEQHHFAFFQLFCHGFGTAAAKEFLCEMNRTVDQTLEMLGDRCKGELGLETAFLGTAKVSHDDDGGTILKKFLDGGERLAHASVVGDILIIVHGDIEIHTEQDFASFKVYIFY